MPPLKPLIALAIFALSMAAACQRAPLPDPSTTIKANPRATVSSLFEGKTIAEIRGCQSDDECTITCMSDGFCCGELCQCETPINKTSREALRVHLDARCGPDVECPVADCPMPEVSYIPTCREGLCVAKTVPFEKIEP